MYHFFWVTLYVFGLHLQGIQTEAAVADLSVGATLDQSFHLRINLAWRWVDIEGWSK